MYKSKGKFAIAVTIFVVYFLLHVIGIGCPIKFISGISCGGCGMTRAWLSVLHLDFRSAFYYHPLFLLLPVYAFVYFFRNKLGHKVFDVINLLFITLFVLVYIIRLIDPNDTVVVFEPFNGIFFKILHIIRSLALWLTKKDDSVNSSCLQ